MESVFRERPIFFARKIGQSFRRNWLRRRKRAAELAANPDPAWNLLKLHRDQLAVSFLCYPGFDVDPHPVLSHVTMINLNTGSVVRRSYETRNNPPILHRKETVLPTDYARISEFSELSRQEEAAGLLSRRFENWTPAALADASDPKGPWLQRTPARQVPRVSAAGTPSEPFRPVERRRTAIKRYDLSKPVKLLLERGLLKKQNSFFDYGCGHGMDIKALAGLGYSAAGWDPAFLPNAPKLESDVVNLGYVLNVIESPLERGRGAARGLC